MAMHFQLHWPPSIDLCAVFTVCRSRQVSSYASRMIQNHAMFWQICRSNGSSDLRRASRVRLRILREAKAMACEAQLVLLHLVHMMREHLWVEGSFGFELWRAFALSLLHGFGLPKRRNSRNSDQTQVNLLNHESACEAGGTSNLGSQQRGRCLGATSLERNWFAGFLAEAEKATLTWHD